MYNSVTSMTVGTRMGWGRGFYRLFGYQFTLNISFSFKRICDDMRNQNLFLVEMICNFSIFKRKKPEHQILSRYI